MRPFRLVAPFVLIAAACATFILSWCWSRDPLPFRAKQTSMRDHHVAVRHRTRLSSKFWPSTGFHVAAAAA